MDRTFYFQRRADLNKIQLYYADLFKNINITILHMTEDDLQLMFDFDEEENCEEVEQIEDEELIVKEDKNYSDLKDQANRLSLKDLRRAVLGWLTLQNPTGAGILVPARLSRYLADVAAFWSKPISIGGKKYLAPAKTALVEIRYDREQCWPDCSNKDELLVLLKAAKENKNELEAYIRKTEPNLRIDDNLFAEFESWNYRKTRNKDYKECIKKINELEKALYNGSKFEKIRRAEIADLLYLAVPEGEIDTEEVADGWGLLYVDSNLNVTLVKEPFNWNCSLEKKHHLVQNISSSCFKDTLFANGIKKQSVDIEFTKLPRRRRK